MQTSQISNAANGLAVATPGKQADANASTESFGQVLSREVADRRGHAEAPKTRDAGQMNKQPANARAKSAEAKPAGEGKTGKDTGAASEASNASAQVSAEMLALVASLTRIAAPAADATEANAVAQDAAVDPALATVDPALAAVDPALAAVDPALATADQATASALNSAHIADRGTQRKIDTMPEVIGERGGKAKPELDPAAHGKAELPAAATMSDVAAKSLEIANSAAKQSSPDFAASMKESLSSVPATMAPVQHAAMQAAQTTAVNGADKLTPAVGTPAWDQALGQKVVWMVAGEQQSASLTLNPPDLGPLQVVLSVSNSQATATFTAAQPEVRQALEAAMPKLRDMLGEAGIQLGQATVNSGSPNQQSSSEQQASQTRRGFERADGGAEVPVHVGRVPPAASGRGLVDTFV